MRTHKFKSVLRCSLATVVLSALSCLSVFAQGTSFVVSRTSTEGSAPLLKPAAESSALVIVAPSAVPREHTFWDKKNRALFAAATALNFDDFAVTRSNLQNGGKELNPMARVFGGSTPGLAANFASQTAGVIGLSYLFHKTGHHKLERIVSIVNISASGAAVFMA